MRGWWRRSTGRFCFRLGAALNSPEEVAVAARASEDIVFNSPSAARRAAKAVAGGGPIVRHRGHDLGGGNRGRPHYHAVGKPNHFFWELALAQFAFELVDPFGASDSIGCGGSEECAQ